MTSESGAHRHLFGIEVRGHDGLGRFVSAAARDASEERRDGVLDAVDRKWLTDHAGRSDEDRMRRTVEGRGCQLRHLLGHSHAVRSGAGIGVSAVDEDSAAHAFFQMETIEYNRCRHDLIGGKHSGDGAFLLGDQQSQVELFLLLFLDAGIHPGGPKADGCGDASSDDLHSDPVWCGSGP